MFNFISKIFGSVALFRTAFYKYKRTIFILTGLGFVSGILGGIGIGAVIPLFSFVAGQDGVVSNDPISETFKVALSFFGVEFSLFSVIVTLALLFIFKAIFVYIANVVDAKAVAEYESETRSEIFNYTMNADWPYLMDQKIGHLSQVIMQDVNKSAGLLMLMSSVILSMTSFLMYAVVAIGISFYISLGTILIGIGMFFVLKPLFYKMRKLSKKEVTVSLEVSHHVNQHLIGSKTVKSFAVEKKVVSRGESFFKELARVRFNAARYNNILGAFLEPFTLAVIIPIFLFSYRDPSFNIASFAAILYLVQKMFSFIESSQAKVSKINQNIPYLVSVINNQTEAKKQLERNKRNGNMDFKFNSLLEFKEIKFNYDNSEKEVLSGLDLKINKGETLGLIGHSGSGKTTIVDLLLQFFDPSAGKITLDGVDITKINLEKWRKNIGYVSQDIFLLNDTIANNIRFYDDSISEDDIIKAAKLANIYEFAIELPEKFDTFVGERGLKLSVGQRQRVVLARVLARNPKLLILDEATSALDNESEVAIKHALMGLRGKVTMLIIAHRLSTIEDSDRLVVLDDGRIIEEGVPRNLLNSKDSHFYKMYHIR